MKVLALMRRLLGVNVCKEVWSNFQSFSTVTEVSEVLSAALCLKKL